MKVSFLGKDLGEASGWDGDLGECWWVYDFTPTGECEIEACSLLQFNEQEGKIETQDKEGNALKEWKISWQLELC